MALTRRQKQVLDFLIHFINRHGYSPSFEEMAAGLHLSSLATVHKHLQVLEKKGFIRRRYNQSRSVEVVAIPGSVPYGKGIIHSETEQSGIGHSQPAPMPTDSIHFHPLPNFEFPLLGHIAAGKPVEAISQPENFSLGDFASRKGKIYVLRVKGDSMVDDHICNGDYILVETAETAQNGEIVVALIGGMEATLKRFFLEAADRVRLQPANAQMDPIVVAAGDVKIQGRVIGVLRKY
ncbi:MAG: transcriptional repressor LexA [Acidobacteria bacterium]|nr:MAG: transcriptional repressor LexA [Acidobacteriota bacterium]